MDKAVRFLRGSDKGMLDRLQERMQQAAEARAYERAGVLRDRLDHMQWMHRRIKQLRTARRRLNGVWMLPGFDQQQLWVVLRSGQLITCTQGHSDPRTGQVLQDAAGGEPDVPKTNLGINMLLLLASWIKKYPDQAKSIVPVDEIQLPNQRARSA
ncbi:MAG: UvrB/UvrC motif-containing protein [Pirellulaceae bacterium]